MINVRLGPVNGKAKEKEKGGPSRQSTLFGLPLGPPAAEKRGRKKKKVVDDSSQSQVDEGGSRKNTPAPEPALVSSTQASDVTMAEGMSEAATLVETQLIDEQCETQLESQAVLEDMNVVSVFYFPLR